MGNIFIINTESSTIMFGGNMLQFLNCQQISD